jgi:hypothetical protein
VLWGLETDGTYANAALASAMRARTSSYRFTA